MNRCALVSILLLVGCGDGAPDGVEFVNYFTGESCTPNPLTYMPKSADPKDHQSNGNQSPTGIPGDNMDDERSGKVDCLYDGNSGQGDDWKYPECSPEDFPQPGCDDGGCCEEDCDEPEDDVEQDPPREDPPEEDPPQEEDDPPQEDPPEEDPV